MIDRKHIERFLQLNGLSASSPDEEIRALLKGARWHPDDIDRALVSLREDPEKQSQRVSASHEIFSSDQKINAETLSALLGMDVEVESVVNKHKADMQKKYNSQIVSLVVVSLFGSVIVLFVVMWIFRVGIFHEYALQF